MRNPLTFRPENHPKALHRCGALEDMERVGFVSFYTRVACEDKVVKTRRLVPYAEAHPGDRARTAVLQSAFEACPSQMVNEIYIGMTARAYKRWVVEKF